MAKGLRRDEVVRVLLVEDSPDHAELICTKLRRSKRIRAEIDHADRLGKGLEKLERGSYDVVLLDFSLPDSFGIETFQRAHEAAPRTPIIVLTSLDDNDLAVQAVRGGAQDYLIRGQLQDALVHRVLGDRCDSGVGSPDAGSRRGLHVRGPVGAAAGDRTHSPGS